jgi:heme exporter protein A
MLELKQVGIQREFEWLLQGISCQAKAGECWHVIGPNGVGKTTLLRGIVGLRTIDAGEIYWQQQPVQENPDGFAKSLLYLGHQLGVTPVLTVVENLKHFAMLSHLPSAEIESAVANAAESVGLMHKLDSRAQDLSAGQKRRVGLSQLWLSSQSLWVLDEPLTALDVQACEMIQKRIAEHCQQGGMALVTSHQPLGCATNTLDLSTYLPSTEISSARFDAEAWY